MSGVLLQLSMVFKLLILLSLMNGIESAIIDIEVKCLGNKIVVGGVCVECAIG